MHDCVCTQNQVYSHSAKYRVQNIFLRRSSDKGASVLCVPRASHYANGKNCDRLFIFLPLKLGIEQMNKVPGKIKISNVLVEIFERPLNIPKRPSMENIGILYNYGPGVRVTKAQRLLAQFENTRTFVRT